MKALLTTFLAVLLYLNSAAQVKQVHYSVEAQGVASSSNWVPFWLRSNQYGSIPLSHASFSYINKLYREYDSSRTRLVDWGISVEGRANLGQKTELTLTEGYGKLRIGIFELNGGRIKQIMGLIDSTLSSGSIAISGNALGIPKIDVAIPHYYSFPFLGELFAFKGNFSHGWLGEAVIDYHKSTVSKAETYFHHKSLYGRLGKPSWKLRLYGGFNHIVYWGNEKSIFGNEFALSPRHAILYMLTGKNLGTENISKVGNHLGSIDLGLEYEFSNIKLLAYRQSFYDKGALYYLANILDGLHGVSLVNHNQNDQVLKWHRLVFEILYAKNQAGESWSRWTPSGPENYYNHNVYAEGHSYNSMGMGTPFISPKYLARTGLISSSEEFFINNRLLLFHVGLQGSVKRWNCISKLSYSRNYGTYETSSVEYFWFKNKRVRRNIEDGVFKEVGQFSTFFEVNKELENKLTVGCVMAVDYGGLYDNSIGVTLKLRKAF